MRLQRRSPCKVNLVLNILGRRPDGYHELETVMLPVPVFDELDFTATDAGVSLTCSHPALPIDASNLVHRAATRFFEATGISAGVRIHLEKHLPLAAGLGGGSANAAVTLSALNQLYHSPLGPSRLHELGAALGSDVPFFLQDRPALALGRGEQVLALAPFPALTNAAMVLVHPGFGISTAWAYQKLAEFPEALNGRRGRADELVRLLDTVGLRSAGAAFFNSLEAPALHKYPVLALYQEFFRQTGAAATLMSGSGSTTFAIFETRAAAEEAAAAFPTEFGSQAWLKVVTLTS
jgi:4-diphosphocytidyl-2-C-methyl-D-erythritol kinase